MNFISNFKKNLMIVRMVLLLGFFQITQISYAQIPVAVMVGEKQMQHEFFFFKDIDKKGRFNVFTMGQFAVDYEQEAFNSSLMSTQITYNFVPGLGVAGGLSFSNQQFRPLVALSLAYMNKKKDFLINLFPSLIIKDQPEYELTGLILYTPKISKNFSLLAQAFIGSTYDEKVDKHLFSFHQVRLGIGYRDWFQVGIGLDQNFFGPEFDNFKNFGVFLRKEF